MIRDHDKKMHPRQFHPGELVLKKILPIHKDVWGKWTPNRERPYVVKQAFFTRALILSEMDGNVLPNPVNSDSIKEYYT